MNLLEIVQSPDKLPVQLADVKAHMNVTEPDFDVTILGDMQAATDMAEDVLDRALITRTSRTFMDCFPTKGTITLPRPNLLSVVQIEYDDLDGNPAVVDPSVYEVDVRRTPGRIVLAPNQNWPDLDPNKNLNRVRVEFTHGYGPNMSDTPQNIRQAVRNMACEMFEQRQVTGAPVSEIPYSFYDLLAPNRFRTL